MGTSILVTNCHHIFRSKFPEIISSLTILLTCIGVCIIDLLIFKTTLKHIIDSYIPEDKSWIKDEFYTSTYLIVIVIAICEIPLVMVKKIEKLKYGTFIGVSGVSVFTLSLIIIFFMKMSEKGWGCHKGCVPVNDNAWEIISVIPNFICAFGYHPNLFPIFKGNLLSYEKD